VVVVVGGVISVSVVGGVISVSVVAGVIGFTSLFFVAFGIEDLSRVLILALI
jgi:hypothetical protein